jgi:metal-dependent amidase/aminoacylase/carboxypeptidase family protein
VLMNNLDPDVAERSQDLSVTSVAAGDGFDGMPEQALLKGTIRTYAEEVRALIRERIEQVASWIVEAYECSAEVTFQWISPVVENDTRVADRVGALPRVLVDEFVLTGHRLMVSEDMGTS